MGRILGIDHGDKRVGLAISDATETFARAFRVIPASENLLAALVELAREEEVERIVLGLPRNMDGSIGPKARQVLEFKERLEEASGLPVDTWDERLTTVQAERALKMKGARRAERARVVDKVAAQILLQSYLDSRKQS